MYIACCPAKSPRHESTGRITGLRHLLCCAIRACQQLEPAIEYLHRRLMAVMAHQPLAAQEQLTSRVIDEEKSLLQLHTGGAITNVLSKSPGALLRLPMGDAPEKPLEPPRISNRRKKVKRNDKGICYKLPPLCRAGGGTPPSRQRRYRASNLLSETSLSSLRFRVIRWRRGISLRQDARNFPRPVKSSPAKRNTCNLPVPFAIGARSHLQI